MPISDYADVDATTLALRVKNKEVTPLELVEAAISAAEGVNGKLNAVVHRMYDKAKAQAAAPLGDGPFAGVPFVFKDLDGYLANEPFKQGSRLSASFVPDHDAEVVARMKATGIIPLVKTACPEFGIMGITEAELYGPTRNPWNTDRTPGGSSGGTAALVAARVVPMGHGGDGGGSIRIPSSACGLFGLKPTRGRNPLGPDIGEGWGGYVVQGVLTRSVRDCAAMLDATSGPSAGAPYASPPAPARPFAELVKEAPRKLRIGFSTRSQLGDKMHPDCVLAVRDAAELLQKLGHEVFEGEPQLDKAALVEAYFTQVTVCVADDIDKTARLVGKTATPDDVEATTWLLAQIGQKKTALDLHHARTACQKAGLDVARWFASARCDLFLNATLAFPPAKIGELGLKPAERVALAALRSVAPKAVLDVILADLGNKALERTPNTQVANQAGLPAMSVPLFWSAEGLPIGVQLTAPFGDEATLLQLAAQLEQERPWIGKKPPVCA